MWVIQEKQPMFDPNDDTKSLGFSKWITLYPNIGNYKMALHVLFKLLKYDIITFDYRIIEE